MNLNMMENVRLPSFGKMSITNDWSILNQVFTVMNEESLFNFDSNSYKVVDFLQPDELKAKINFTVGSDENLEIPEILNLLRSVIRYSVKTNHPYFRNQLYGQMDSFGLAGSILTECLNTSGYTFEVGPVFSLIEAEMIEKLCELIDFNDGIFAPGGSISIMYAMVLARHKQFPEVKSTGLSGLKPMVVFTSEESHYGVRKAANWLGIGMNNCILVKTDIWGKMIPADLEAKILIAREQKKLPFFVNATAGSTVLGAFDDIEEIGKICKKYGIWMHVDGCHGGAVMLSPKSIFLLNGLNIYAQSFAWDPHKACGAPLQCAIFLTKEKDLLSECNSMNVNYLFPQDNFYDISYDIRNKSFQCGRKVDAFKLWLMFKARGMNSFGTLVDYSILTSKIFARKIRSRSGFRLIQKDFEYTNVCFWYIPKRMRNLEESLQWFNELSGLVPKIKEQMVRTGTIMVGYSPLAYRNYGNFFRMVFTCFPQYSETELEFLINQIENLGEQISA